jgi:hypothetical protein
MTVEKYIEGVEQIYREKPDYALGHDGSDGKCDCIGMCKGALRRGGETPQNLSGTNYAARFGIDNLQKIVGSSQLKLGQVVLKARSPGDSGYSLPEQYRKGGSKDTGDYLDYYHIGTVTSVFPLEITHMTSPTAKKDTKLGKWGFVGDLPQVSGVEPSPTPEPTETATVWSANGRPVNLRKSPNRSAALVDQVPCGDTVRILSDDGEWCHVQWRKKTGYMMREFLRIESGALYTVEIPHLTFDQASALMSYPGATMTEERG